MLVHMNVQRISSRLRVLAAGVLALACAEIAVAQSPGMVEVKLGLGTLSKAERANLWVRVDEYATVDAMHEYCASKRKLNIQRRALSAVSPCIDASSLRKVAAVFRSKKAANVKAWEAAHTDAEKKQQFCAMWAAKMPGYARIIDSQIAEAASMCSACLIC